MEEEKKGFVVRDRRIFDEKGETRETQEAPREQERPKEEPKRETGPREEASEDYFYPEVNFANFILSLSTTAMFHFGDFPDPASGQTKKNLAAAKHAIDTIAMLRSKTEGNLDADEKSLIDGILFELRMRYVKESS
ncbi:MAG TPA: DUF1844 domain-containing protein [Syntrophales bacterium]|nr:DUF1844 domain-containing protein [Syntrophales bacterium]HOM06701.1 DUF1844 domain-containing protein [Syntrophales bacterium]HOO00923.1 DUF1844 domain-containing protein [Syntrophales bacterium]HPC01623.1 DUF1844 domain-containing protein [Syntrophales bacterium]HPQ06362.1 DUF1844 domain-containing protein [Syntrophales bacterium]